jgi:hypothetical protein
MYIDGYTNKCGTFGNDVYYKCTMYHVSCIMYNCGSHDRQLTGLLEYTGVPMKAETWAIASKATSRRDTSLFMVRGLLLCQWHRP